MTRTEQALQALVATLTVPALPPIRRSAIFDDVLDELGAAPGVVGALILQDGDADAESIALGDGDGVFDIVHRAELEWIVAGREDSARDSTFDAGLEAIAVEIKADRTLGGAVDLAELRDPPERGLDIAGAKPAKTARIIVTLQFQSPEPF